MDISVIFGPVTKAVIKNYKHLPRYTEPHLDPIEESWEEARKTFYAMKGKKIHNYRGLFKIQSEIIQEVVCTNRDGMILPEYMGLLIAGFDSDKSKSKKYKNVHSNGMVGKIIWTPNYKSIVQRDLKVWKFKACTEFRAKIVEAFTHTPQIFKIFDLTKRKKRK